MFKRIVKISFIFTFLLFSAFLVNSSFATTIDYSNDPLYQEVKSNYKYCVAKRDNNSLLLYYLVPNPNLIIPDGFDCCMGLQYSSGKYYLDFYCQRYFPQDLHYVATPFAYEFTHSDCSYYTYRRAVFDTTGNQFVEDIVNNSTGFSNLRAITSSMPILESNFDIYLFSSDYCFINSANLIFEANVSTIPTEQEAYETFDFKVNINFNQNIDNENFIDRSDNYSALVTHDLDYWDNYYNVKLDITNSQTGLWNIWNNRIYLDYYDVNNELLEEKLYLQGKGNTNYYHFNVEEGDYYNIFTSNNNNDIVTLKYFIYSKLDNSLIVTREISFIFTTDNDPIRETISGRVWEDNYYDKDGNSLSSTKESVSTNGSNTANSEITNSQMDINLNKYYSANDLNSLATNAKDTINIAQICFSMLPGFIWVIVSVSLTVAIALRILGR